ncbi:MAG: tripartite tricarboxylate transporter permease, partial [Sphaerochaetaceae bacterium]|nr:tripartite tricarboxylate transporter permease [Sphaerochaetaceae bacterium]
VSAFVSYNEAKRSSKHPENFGKGEMAGVVASESANNGATGATLIPLLTLGIPGDVVTAVLLGAFMIQGLTPGPLLFKDHGSTIFAIFAGFFIINIVMMIFGIVGVKYFAHVNSLPAELLYSIIFVMCAVGSFAVDNTLFNVGVVLVFGLVGYVFRKLELPGGPFLIAFLLGPLFESNLRRTVILFDGNMALIFTKPIAVFFLVLCAVSLFFILRNNRKESSK